MPTSFVPSGLPAGVALNGTPHLVTMPLLTQGKLLFVNSAHSQASTARSHGTLDRPFSTGAAALAECRANQGDSIVVLAGHSESVATLLALNTVEGVTFAHLGLGVSWKTGTPAGELVGTSIEQLVATAVKTLPAVADLSQDLFTVAGGLCLVQELFGIVRTVIQAQGTTLQLRSTSTGLSAVTLTGAAGDINAAAVGTVISMTGTLANNITISANQAHVAQAAATVVGPGIIDGVFGAESTGAIQWYCRYKPLQPGAYITPA